jgi:Tfp pilus assembly protein PilF
MGFDPRSSSEAALTPIEWPHPEPGRRHALLALTIGILAIASSFNGLWNDFAYDDLFIVRGNELVHQLDRAWTLFVLPYWPIRLGGDGYRPLTLLAFALQWAALPGSAMLFHAVAIGLYAAVSITAFRLASLLLPTPQAWIAAALFAVHPVHVEAVANVVGQSELWAGLLILSATASYIEHRRAGTFTGRRQVFVGAMYLAACLFKEHAVVLPIVLLAAEALAIGDAPSVVSRLRASRRFYLLLLLVGVVYVAFRQLVINKELGGFAPYIPFVTQRVGLTDRLLTMLGIVPEWLRLLVWPAKLSSEYGPPEYPIATGPALDQLPGLLILILAAALAVATARRAPIVAFGIAWTAITLLPSSNLLLPSGILLAERTLFTPSFGAMLVVAAGTSAASRNLRYSWLRVAALVCVGSVLWAGVAASIIRSAVWRNNDTLFAAAVKDSPDVYRSHYMLGAWHMTNKRYLAGEREYLIAMRLFSHDPFVAFNLGQEYFEAGSYERAFELYRRAEQILPGFQNAMERMALTRAVQGRYAEAKSLALEALRKESADVGLLRSLLEAASLDERSRRRLAERIVAKRAEVVPR